MRRVALLAVLLLAGCGGGNHPKLAGNELTPSSPAPNFSLTDQSGRTVSLAAQRGHWAVVTFLYTHCPDVCPLIAANLNGALASAEGKHAGLRVLAVSVDPRRDTPAAVRTYAVQHRLKPGFHFLIGSPAKLAGVWRAYHVAARPGPKGTVTHSTFEILVDPKGEARLIYDATITTAELTGDLAKLGA